MRWGPIRWRSGPARWRYLPAALAMALAAGSAAGPPPALATWQGSVYSNWTAFNPCLGINDTFPEKMRKNAAAAFTALGLATTSFTKDAFTRAKFLARTPADYAVYVHSHGDFYGGVPGFRIDGGVCSGAVVSSTNIASKRAATQQTNLVVMSTCHLGENVTKNNMPLVYGIEKVKAGSNDWRGPEFYLGYVGTVWDSDQWEFETIFWDRLLHGSNVGQAFDLALGSGTYFRGFAANWWGSYVYSGVPGPYSGCKLCL